MIEIAFLVTAKLSCTIAPISCSCDAAKTGIRNTHELDNAIQNTTQCIVSPIVRLIAEREVFKHTDTFAEEREEDEDMLEQAAGAVGATGGAESSKEQ